MRNHPRSPVSCTLRVLSLESSDPAVRIMLGNVHVEGKFLIGCPRSRKENLEKARAHWQAGNTSAAFDCYQKAIDISPATAKQFIEVTDTSPECPTLVVADGLFVAQ